MTEAERPPRPEVSRDPSRPRQRIRYLLFLFVGLALPFYAFPVARVYGRQIDVATILAAAFVLASVPELPAARPRAAVIFLFSAAIVPLLTLFPPKPRFFSPEAFAGSYAHWLLIVFFFVSVVTLRISPEQARSLVRAEIAMGVFVSLFALYQALGVPRHWPGTDALLVSWQREPFRFTRIGGTYLAGGYTRPTSFFLEPAWMGGYLAWVLALRLGWARQAGEYAQGALRFLAILLLICALLASASWGAYVDLGVVLAATFAALRERKRKLRFILPILAGVLAAGLALFSPPGKMVLDAVAQRWRMLRETPTARAESSGEIKDSSWIRLRNVDYTLHLWSLRPLRGVGLGQFRRYAGKDETQSLQRFAEQDPWCGWLAISSEVGILGSAILLAAIAGIYLWSRSAPAGAEFQTVVFGLLALAVVQQLHTGSYLDLWWWYPLTLAAALAATDRSAKRPIVRATGMILPPANDEEGGDRFPPR